MRYYLIFLILSYVICGIHSASFPEKWERCKVSPNTDNKRNKCLEGTIKKIVTDLAENDGNAEFKIDGLSPLKFNHLFIGQGNPSSSVKLQIEFKKLELYGFPDIIVKRIDGKLSSPKDFHLKFEFEIPKINIKSEYKSEGSILILPIVGSGKCELSFKKVTAVSQLYGQPQIKDGKEYVKIVNHTLSIDVKGMTTHLENLFNGNKILGDNMNKIMNENWEIIYQELRPSMEKNFDKNFSKYIRKILEKFAFKDMFIVE